MDKKKGVNIFHELSNMQCKISSLFQDVWTERNHYKTAVEDLESKVETLIENIENLKTQNNVLKQNYVEMKSIVLNYVTLLHQMDFSKPISSPYFTSVTETFKHKILQIGQPLQKKPPPHLAHNYSLINLKSEQKKCIESKKLSKDTSMNRTKDVLLNHMLSELFESSSTENYGTLNKENIIKKICSEEPVNLQTIVEETFHQDSITLPPEESENKLDVKTVNKNSEFKSLGFSKQNKIFSDEFESKRQQTLINGNDLSTAEHLFVRPLKRKFDTVQDDSLLYLSTPKRFKARLKSKLNSSIQFPESLLRKSNSKDVIVSSNGTKKLTQTLLNVEIIKRGLETSKINEESKNSNVSYSEKVKLSVEKDEDDLIWESPKKGKVLKESAILKGEYAKNLHRSQSPLAIGITDLDETYIPSEIIESNKLIDHQIFSSCRNRFLKYSIREKSPEYDSASFTNERKLLENKPDEMKISGKVYLDYKVYLKDVPEKKAIAKNLENSLNNCSRNRSKNFSSIDNTPPGYWKPYLTATNIPSSEDNTVIQ